MSRPVPLLCSYILIQHQCALCSSTPGPQLCLTSQASGHLCPVSLNNLGKMSFFWLLQLELSKPASLGTPAHRLKSCSSYIVLIQRSVSLSPRAAGSCRAGFREACGGGHNSGSPFARTPLCWRKVEVTESPVWSFQYGCFTQSRMKIAPDPMGGDCP